MLYIPKARLKKQFNVTQPHFSFEISEVNRKVNVFEGFDELNRRSHIY